MERSRFDMTMLRKLAHRYSPTTPLRSFGVGILGLTVSILCSQNTAWGDDPPERTITVESSSFTPRCNESGRVSSVTRVNVSVSLEEFTGSLELSEVLRKKGSVTQGDVLLRIDGRELERSLRDHRETTENTRARLNLLKDRQRLLLEEHRSRIERAEMTHKEAEQELLAFKEHDSPQMIRAAQLTETQRRLTLIRRQQELDELENSYENSDISPDRKQELLKRAQNYVEVASKLLEMASSEVDIIKKVREPKRKAQYSARVDQAAERVQRMRERQRISEELQQEEIREVERALRNQEERVERLTRDRERLTVKAPQSGMLAPIELQKGDLVPSRTPISEVYDPQNLVVRVDVPAPSLRLLEVGKTVDLQLKAYPDVSLNGTVSAIGDLGNIVGDETHYPVEVAIAGKHRLLRIGLRCAVRCEGAPLEDVISIPTLALRGRRESPVVEVWRDGNSQRVAVVVGMHNDTHVQVLKGLADGDKVVLPPAP